MRLTWTRASCVAVVVLLTAGLFPLARPAFADSLGQPTVAVGVPASAPIGTAVTVPVTFDNPAASAVGYGPYVVLCVPVTGADGAGAAIDDGLSFAGATYLGAPVTAFPLPLDASNHATNPLTNQQITCPAGFKAGDQAVVLQLPFGSFTAAQPAATISVSLNLSNLADLGTALPLAAIGGYQFGDTATGANGPLPAGATTATVAGSLTPALYTLTKAYVGPESETATGPNFPRRYRLSASIAPGQTITNLKITDPLPPTEQYTKVTEVKPVSPAPAATATPSTSVPGGTLTRTFASVTGTGGEDAAVEFEFYVPENGATGPTTPVLSPTSGAFRNDATTTNGATSSGTWKPIDTRDNPATPVSADAAPHKLEEQSIAVQKGVSILNDVGVKGPSPGDTLQWTLDVQVSDYFTFDQLKLDDVLHDGQTLVAGSATLVKETDASTGVALTAAGPLGPRFVPSPVACPAAASSAPPPHTRVAIDLSGAMTDHVPADGIMAGGLAANRLANLGAATATITFKTTIDQAFTCDTTSGNKILDPGDLLGNDVTVTGRVLNNVTKLPTGSVVSDDSAAGVSIPRPTVAKSLYALNGSTTLPAAPVQTAPGDRVTYRIEATVPVGSVENLSYTDYLPLPILSAAEVATFDDTTNAAVPVAGHAKFGPTDTFRTATNGPPTLSRDTIANSLAFAFGTRDTDGSKSYAVDLLFTVTTSTNRYADDLFLTNQVRQSQNNSFASGQDEDAIVQIKRTEPILSITKGVVSTTNPNALLSPPAPGPAGVVWSAPGAAAGFTGTVTSTGLAATPVNSDVSGLDAGDLVRFAIVVDNKGTGIRGAFNVRIRDTLPAGFVVPPGGAGIGLTVTDGRGVALPFTSSGSGLFDTGPGGIVLTDPSATKGALDPDSASSGTDIAVLTYTLLLPAPGTADNKTLTNTATLANYSGNAGGPDYTPADLTDPATARTALPLALKKLVATSEATSADPDVVVGEKVHYHVDLSVPEGTIAGAKFVDTFPADSRLALVSLDSLTVTGAGLSTSIAGGFPAVKTNAVVGAGGLSLTLDLGTLTNANTDNTAAETIGIDYTAVVLNSTVNQAGVPDKNSAKFISTNTPAGSAPASVVTLTVREPDVPVTKSVTPTNPASGQIVTYTIKLSPNASSKATAFDVSLSDVLPTGLSAVAGTFTQTSGLPATSKSQSGNTLSASFAKLAPADAPPTFTVQARIDDIITNPTMTNVVNSSWSSLPGDQTAASTLNNALSVERTGNTANPGGASNDYRSSANAVLTVPSAITKSLLSTSAAVTSGNDVTIGETAGYRLTVTLPEGELINGFTVTDAVPAGMGIVAGSVKVDTTGYNGTLGPNTMAPAGDGTDGQDLSISFGDTKTVVDSVGTNNSFAVTFTTRVLDVAGNVGVAPRTSLPNTATLTLTGGTPQTTPAVTLTVAEPKLDVTKTMAPAPVHAGDTVTITIKVTNTGTSAAFSPVITDPIDGAFFTSVAPGTKPAGWAASYSAGALRFEDDPATAGEVQIDPGTSVTFTGTAVVLPTVTDQQQTTNVATVANTSTLPGTVAGERVEPPVTATATDVALTPDLAITKTDNLVNVSPGQTLVYTLHATNHGGADAPNTVVKDTLPPGTTFVSASGGGTLSGGVITFPAFTLAAGAAKDLTVTVTVERPVAAGLATLPNRADIAYDNSRGVDKPGDNTATDVDTIIAANSSLAGVVYVDRNNNGTQDPGEPGIGGVTVTVTGTDVNGQAVNRPVTTAADGSYLVDMLVPGTYTVTETQPSAWNDGTDKAGTKGGTVGNDVTSAITLPAATNATGYLFGEVGTLLSGRVYVDANRNSSPEAGEGGLGGVKIDLKDAAGNVVATTTTAGDGTYSFMNLAAGNYTVLETQPAGYGSSPGTPDTRPVIVPKTGLTGVDFGDTLSTLAGRVYVDTNRSGAFDNGEPAIAGVTVTLTGTDDAGAKINQTTATAADGTYSFRGLKSGSYTITESQPAQWNDGGDTVGSTGGDGAASDVTSAIKLPGGGDGTGYNFGEVGTTLSGRVFVDKDRDKIFNGADGGFSGVTLTLRDTNGAVVATTTTAIDGTYSFTNLAAGTYTVTETQPVGYGSSTPDVLAVTLPLAGLTGVDFGDTTSTLAGFVYVDKGNDGVRGAGEPPIPGTPVKLSGTDVRGISVSATATTAADGSYTFTGLLAGTYTITETQPGQWNDGRDTLGTTGGNLGADTFTGIPLGAGADGINYNFGELGAALSGRVFVDGNRDGASTGDPGLGGVAITLRDSAGNAVATTMTASDGTYSFTDLPFGDYTVAETQPGGYGSSTPDQKKVTLAKGGLSGIDFGETLSSLAGTVYLDKNNNGTDDSEPPIGGVTVTLTGTDANGKGVSASTITKADGTYSFTGLVGGSYTVTETQPAAWNDGLDKAGSAGGNAGNDVTSAVTLPGGADATGYDFGEVGTVLSGRVFLDANRNGVPEAPDGGLTGVTVTLLDAADHVVATTITGAGGAYSFKDLPAGHYTVVETQPKGYGSSTGDSRAVDLPLAGLANQDFGDTLSSLSGAVYVDLDNDGVADPGEPPIPGVVVTLSGSDANGKTVTATATTDANGAYTFPGLLSGSYSVSEAQPNQWNDGKDTVGTAGGLPHDDNTAGIPLGAGVDGTGYLFGERGTTLAGRVYLDGDRNGARAAGDPGIAGVTVTLRGPDGVVRTAITAADGSYAFTDLPAGKYTVTETQPSGYASSTPDSQAVDLPLAGRTDLDFGDTASTIAGTVFHDRNDDGHLDPGEPGIGAVVVTLTGKDVNGLSVTRETTTDADGRWSFTGLLAGSYTVTETQPGAWNDGRDALGSSGGTPGNDHDSAIALPAGTDATAYDFGELGAPLAGTVYVDTNRDKTLDGGEKGLGGVTIELKDGTGKVVERTTTMPDGSFSFPNVAPGSYTVVEKQPAGYGSSTEDSVPVTVGPGGTGGVRFGETVSTLAGLVYLDKDNDGTRTATELGIGVVAVRLTGKDAAGHDVDRMTTSLADGSWSFTDLLAGTYTVTETQPGQWNDGQDAAGTAKGTAANDVTSGIALPAGFDATGYLFGERGTTLSGTVFVDANHDQTLDGAEGRLGGVTVTLFDADTNALIASTTTGPGGSYTFTDLPAGRYRVEESQPTGYGTSTPNSVTVDLPLTGRSGVDFGETLSSLSGSVFVDRDGNGDRGAGEPGIGGVTLTLSGRDANGRTVNATAVTDPDGNYRFDGLLAGSYTVTEAQPGAWNDGLDTAGAVGGSPGGPGSDAISAVGLPPGTDAPGYLFGEVGAPLSGRVFYDDARNQAFDGPDHGLGGVTITLTDNGNHVVGTTTTLSDGTWMFTDLPAGRYTVTETQPAGYGSSTDDVRPVEVPKAGLGGIDFGDTLSSLSGVVYVDRNDNAARDAGEPGIGGVTVRLTGRDDAGHDADRTATTADDGSYTFGGLASGTYTVTETQPGRWNDGKDTAGAAHGTVADDVTSGVALGVGADAPGYLFGERGTTLSGTVFVDGNRSTALDGGEGGLGGVAVTLLDAKTGALVATTTTAADGTYSFTDLPTGSYLVLETQPKGYGSSTDDGVPVDLPLGGRTGVDFGETLSSLSGSVYVDRNGNGTRDPGEPGIAGVPIKLNGNDANNKPVTATATTDADGRYTFAGLLSGSYTVKETQPDAWNDGLDAVGTVGGTPADDALSAIGLPPGTDATGYVFGELGAVLSGRVFYDPDRDGKPAVGDQSLGGVTVTLKDKDGKVIATTTTADDGTWSFRDLPAGTYTVEESQPDGYGSSTPDVRPVDLPKAGLGGVDFGETLSALSGSVYVDRNDDGKRDTGEPGIPGVTVKLSGTDANGKAVARTAVTGSDGSYSFGDLLAGTYRVIETQPGAWNDGQDAAGSAAGTVGDDDTSAIKLGPGVDAPGYLFGELGAVLSGRVFLDPDRNGKPGAGDPGDPGVPGVKLSLLDGAGNVVDTTTTGSDGTYSFRDLPAGSYSVVETQPSGYGSSSEDHLDVALPKTGRTGLDFGETLSTLSGAVYVDKDDDGKQDKKEPGIGGVTVNLTGTDATGATVSRTTTTAADGSWSFTDLLAGSYTVTETQPPAWNDGRDAVGTAGGGLGADTDTAIPLDPGVDGTGYLFGERGTTVSGKVFVDSDRDGKPAVGDQSLGGITVTLRDPESHAVLGTTTTRDDGTYAFTDLPAGRHDLDETQPAGYGSSSADAIKADVPLAGLANQDYGETLGTVSGSVYVDANDNGVRDPGEVGIPGVTVRLTGTDVNGHAVSETVVTCGDVQALAADGSCAGGAGSFSFTGLLAGTYSVTETQPAAYVDGKDAAGPAGGGVGDDKVTAVSLPAGGDAPANLFGEKPTADLVLAKTHIGTAQAGNTLDYTIAVLNRGPSVASGPVTLTDPLPAGESFAAASGAGWECSAAGRTVTCTRAEPLAVGSTALLTLTVGLAGNAPSAIVNRATVAGPTSDVDPGNNTAIDPLSVEPLRPPATVPPDVKGIVIEGPPDPAPPKRTIPVTGAEVGAETRAASVLLELGLALLLAARALSARLRRRQGL